MDTIAYIIDEQFIYWNSIILTLAVCAAICIFLFLFLREKKNGIAAALLIPIALVSSIFASRAIHWYWMKFWENPFWIRFRRLALQRFL